MFRATNPAAMLAYDGDGRPWATSGRFGPQSPRDRRVDVEIVMGELGCGDLIYELREQFERVDSGQLVRVVSDDPGAPKELPAWCRLTRHRLLEADAPYYIVRARTK